MAKPPAQTTDQQLLAAIAENQKLDQQQQAQIDDGVKRDDAQDARLDQNNETDAAQSAEIAALKARLEKLEAGQSPAPDPAPDPAPQPEPQPEPQPDPAPQPDPMRLTDPAGNLWTIGTGGATLKNGEHFAWGYGSEYRLVDGVVQVLGTDNNWWAVVGDGWRMVGPGNTGNDGGAPQPAPAPAPSTGEPAIVAPLWRVRPSPSTVIRTPAELIAARLVLPMSADVAFNVRALPAYTYVAGPNAYENAGLQKYMGATGERQEIGLATEAQGAWVAGGSPDNMMVQAEAHGCAPIHATIDGQIIDVLKYPLATFDGRAAQSNHQNWRPWFKDDGTATVTPDGSHYPALTYIPYLASGDRRHLEELQFAATFHICGGPPDYAGGKGILYPWQQRLFGWCFRDIIAAYIATLEAEKSGPVTLPLKPSSYWKEIIDNNIAFYTERYINKGGPLVQEMGFLACDDLNYLAPWQQDYISAVLGWAVWTGRVPQLRPLYDFQIRQAVKRATGPLRSQAIQYNFPSGVADSWATSLAKNGRSATADGHYDAGVVGPVPDYPNLLRGALAIAVRLNVPGAAEAFAYADAEAKAYFVTRRWAFTAA